MANKLLAVIAVVATAVSIVSGASAADAARKPSSVTPALVATPGDVTYSDSAVSETFTGCGYRPATPTTIVVNGPAAVSFFGGLADASGCISITHNGFITQPGTYAVSSWQKDPKSGKAVVVGSTSFVVQ